MGLPKIKSVTELRGDIFSAIREVLKGQTQLITHKDGDSVLISKKKYDELTEKIETLEGISRGLLDLAESRYDSEEDTLKMLKKHIAKNRP